MSKRLKKRVATVSPIQKALCVFLALIILIPVVYTFPYNNELIKDIESLDGSKSLNEPDGNMGEFPENKEQTVRPEQSGARGPGVLDHVNIEDAPGGVGSVIQDVIITFEDTLMLYAVGYDSEGGYVEDLNMSWGFHSGGSISYIHDTPSYRFKPDQTYVGVESYWFSVEDMLNKYDFPSEYNRTGNITVWWPFPDPERDGTIDIIVNDSVYLGPENIQTNLTRYVNDIETDPYKPYSVSVYNRTWANESEVKDILIDDYNNNNLIGAVLVGDVPAPWYEGNFKSNWEEFPMDFYYMDLDGTWTDSDSDGKYDAHTGATEPDIIIGRLSPSCITTLTGKTEKWLLNNYFEKNNAYRTGTLTVNYRGLSYGEFSMTDKWSNLYDETLTVSNGNKTDYQNKLSDGYESVWVNAHGMITAYNLASNTEIRDLDPPCLFYALHSCTCGYYADPNKPGNIANMHTFTNNYGLATFASSQIMWSQGPIKIKELEQFKKMGDAINVVDYAGLVGLHTFGDPLLRISEPPWDSVEIESKGYITKTSLAERGEPIINVLLEPGQSLDLYALGTRDGGTTVKADSFVTWSVTGSLDPVNTGPSRWVRYTPTTDFTSGTITCTDSYGHTDFVNVIVNSSLPDHILIVDAPNGAGSEITTYTMTADDELIVYAAGYDPNNQYVADILVTWDTTGTLDSVSAEPSTHMTFSPSTAPTSGTIIADDGDGHTASTGTITVNPGALYCIVIRDAPLGGGSEVTSHSMTTDDTYQIWAAGYDAENNFIDDIVCNWSSTGTLPPPSPGPSTNLIYAPTIVGGGILITDDGSGHADETGDILVLPGALDHIWIVKRPGGGATNTLKLWPRADGDHIGLAFGWDNWDMVNNDPPTDYLLGEYVALGGNDGFDWGYDLYKIDFPQPIPGPIEEVRVYFRISSQGDALGTNGTPILYLSGEFSNGTMQPHTQDAFTTYSQVLSRPGGGSWSFEDLCNLQVGIELSNYVNPFTAYCSQLYMEVKYTNDVEFGDWSMMLNDSLELYAVGFDSHDNYKGEVSCTWDRTGSLDSPSAGPSVNITFSPSTAPSYGTITADDGAGHTDETGMTSVDCRILQQGWNLISVPLIQSEENIDSVLSSITGKYDAIQWYDVT
ncbi:MAG: hypothetical protein JSV56_13140, partial [Methanomassiliicoccales archaeon]